MFSFVICNWTNRNRPSSFGHGCCRSRPRGDNTYLIYNDDNVITTILRAAASTPSLVSAAARVGVFARVARRPSRHRRRRRRRLLRGKTSQRRRPTRAPVPMLSSFRLRSARATSFGQPCNRSRRNPTGCSPHSSGRDFFTYARTCVPFFSSPDGLFTPGRFSPRVFFLSETFSIRV